MQGHVPAFYPTTSTLPFLTVSVELTGYKMFTQADVRDPALPPYQTGSNAHCVHTFPSSAM